MKLIWFLYQNNNKAERRNKPRRKYILGILLGERYNKLDILLSNKVNESESALIRAALSDLKKMNVIERITWMRKFMPSMFRKAYRTIFKSRIEILDEMEIKPL